MLIKMMMMHDDNDNDNTQLTASKVITSSSNIVGTR